MKYYQNKLGTMKNFLYICVINNNKNNKREYLGSGKYGSENFNFYNSHEEL